MSQDIDAMNAKIDVLFEQIAALEGDKRFKADAAVGLWRSAKTCEALGLGPMEARHEYRAAYEALSDLGLEVGGMRRPYSALSAAGIAEMYSTDPLVRLGELGRRFQGVDLKF
jgi:hypothetical protein